MFAGLKKWLWRSGGAHAQTSKTLARSRLHFVLVQDRTGLSPEELARFRHEMVSVIERYFVIDKRGFDISYKRESDTTTLLINSPVIIRRQEAVGHEVGVRRSPRKKKKHRMPPPPPPAAATTT